MGLADHLDVENRRFTRHDAIAEFHLRTGHPNQRHRRLGVSLFDLDPTEQFDVVTEQPIGIRIEDLLLGSEDRELITDRRLLLTEADVHPVALAEHDALGNGVDDARRGFELLSADQASRL